MAAPIVRIADLLQHDGKEVRLQGWLYRLRKKGRLAFVMLRDGSGIAQCVAVRDEVPPEQFEAVKGLTQESSLEVVGTARSDERAPGGVEVKITSVTVHQVAEPYPITPKEHGAAFLLDNRHLWLRSKRQMALMRLRHEVIRSFRGYLDCEGFYCVDSPMFTPNACEGTSTLFEVDYFGEPAYLTQSGQLYAEASAMALGRVYCFGPTFRAEKSKTRR
ncbi:MAG TPA: amino acid--tRNA ligase-related protein, partial [Planctomycetota bacterium]